MTRRAFTAWPYTPALVCVLQQSLSDLASADRPALLAACAQALHRIAAASQGGGSHIV
jgi:hypothetical protein